MMCTIWNTGTVDMSVQSATSRRSKAPRAIELWWWRQKVECWLLLILAMENYVSLIQINILRLLNYSLLVLLLVWRHVYEEGEAGWIDAVLRSSVGCKWCNNYIISVNSILLREVRTVQGVYLCCDLYGLTPQRCYLCQEVGSCFGPGRWALVCWNGSYFLSYHQRQIKGASCAIISPSIAD